VIDILSGAGVVRLALLTVVLAAPSLFAQATPRASSAPLAKTPPAKATTVAPKLQQPIQQLAAAIESRLPSKMEEVYNGYKQDERTRRYFDGFLDRADMP
jgi:hypothetical protein